jgi:hypothetical protein
LITDPPGHSIAAAPFSGIAAPELQRVFGTHPLRFEHVYANDERFTLDALAPFIASVPRSWVRAEQVQYSPHEARGLCALDPNVDLADVVRGLADAPASLRTYNLELTSEFRPLHDQVEPVIRDLVGPREGGLVSVNLGVFLASPGSVTPAHPDRHHNLLLQVIGPKELYVEDDPDRRAHHLRVVDYLRCPADGAPVLPPAERFVVEPGDGVYIPPYAYHWTTVLEGPAVGLSIGFSTRSTVRSSRVHDLDVKLRRRGLSPRPAAPGSPKEHLKAGLATASVRTAHFRGRFARSGGRGTVSATSESGTPEGAGQEDT